MIEIKNKNGDNEMFNQMFRDEEENQTRNLLFYACLFNTMRGGF